MVLQPHGHVDTGWGGLGHVLIGSQSLCPGVGSAQRSSFLLPVPIIRIPPAATSDSAFRAATVQTQRTRRCSDTVWDQPRGNAYHAGVPRLSPENPIRCRHMPPRAVHREFVPFGVPECAGQTVLKPQPHQEPHAPGQVRAPLGHSKMGRRSCPSLTPITDTGHKRVGTGPERRLGAGGSGMRL